MSKKITITRSMRRIRRKVNERHRKSKPHPERAGEDQLESGLAEAGGRSRQMHAGGAGFLLLQIM